MSNFRYTLSDSNPVSRRSFFSTTGSLAAAALWSSCTSRPMVRRPHLAGYPFTLGVASGDPAADGFVLWTRLAPRPLEWGGMPLDAVEVSWQVAEDEAMTKVVRQGWTVALPDWAHAVHVELMGLRPDRWYWYRFKLEVPLLHDPPGREVAVVALRQLDRIQWANSYVVSTGPFRAWTARACRSATGATTTLSGSGSVPMTRCGKGRQSFQELGKSLCALA